MVSAARHNELVNFMMDELEDLTKEQMMQALASRFGEFTFAEFDRAALDAQQMLNDRDAEAEIEKAEMARFLPLFGEEDDLDEPMGAIAARKAADGNQLAVEFLQWAEGRSIMVPTRTPT